MKTRIDFSRANSLIISLFAAGAILLALVALTAGFIPVSAAPVQTDCFATPDGGPTLYDSTDSATALREAVAAASPGGEVWVAGTCSGAVTAGGSTQVLLLNKDLTLVGYTYDGDWHYVPQQRAAIDAQSNGRVIRIVGEVHVVLDNLHLANGRTSTAAAHGAGIAADGATLTISNSVLVDNDAEGSTSAGGGVYATRHLTLLDTSFLSNTAGSGGGLSAHGTAQISGGRFQNNHSNATGGAIITYRSLTISDTRFLDNTAAGSRAGAVLSRAAGDDTLVITNAHFENNRCTYAVGCAGGALFTYNPVDLTGSTFTGNSATGTGFASGGGAIYALAEIDIRGSILRENETPAHGGAIYVQAPLTLRDSEIVANVAGRQGGGIWNSGMLVVDNSLIAANRSTASGYNGGGIYNSGSLSLLASEVISNEAYSSGGIYNVDGASLTIAENALFRGNRATGSFGSAGGVRNQGVMAVEDAVFEANDGGSSGGGIDNGGELTARHVVFRDNVAESGGALNNANSGDATISDALFERNMATGALTELSEPGGGAIRNSWGTVEVADSTFRNNQAVYRGGAIYNAGRFQATLVMINTKVINNAAESGGAFYLLQDVTVDASRIFSNTASAGGGGLTIAGGANITLHNNFIAANTGTSGDALYFDGTGDDGAVLAATHNTFVGSAGTTATGTAVESAATGPGQELNLTNLILSGYTVGVQMGGVADNATLDGILWHEVATTTSGGNVTVTHAYTGNPQFVNPGSANYHIEPGSIAVDRGVTTPVDRDIDFEPRPQAAAADLGADEVGPPGPGIGNYVWEDADGDGLQDAGESGLAGVVVTLLDANGQVVDTATTNDAGYYFFALAAAGEYRLHFEPPSGYLFGPANQGDDDDRDSDADPATGLTPLFSFAGDTIDHSWDAALSSSLPDLFINKDALGTLFVDPGRHFTYRLTFGNRGVGVAYDVLITDLLPTDLLTDITYEVEGVVITPTTGITHTWQVAPLPAGSEGSIEIRATVREGFSAGTAIENVATIAGSEDEETLANNSDDVLVTVADAAPIAFDDGGFWFTTSPGTAFTTGNVLANDREPNGEALTIVDVDTGTLQGQLTSNGDGTFVYDPAGAFAHLGPGQTATDLFSYTVSDEGGNTDTATVRITIQGEGHALYLPLIMRDGAVRANRPSVSGGS